MKILKNSTAQIVILLIVLVALSIYIGRIMSDDSNVPDNSLSVPFEPTVFQNEEHDYRFEHHAGHRVNSSEGDFGFDPDYVFIHPQPPEFAHAYFGVVAVDLERLIKKDDVYDLELEEFAQALWEYNGKNIKDNVIETNYCYENEVSDLEEVTFGQNAGYLFSASICLTAPVAGIASQPAEAFITADADGNKFIVWSIPDNELAERARESLVF